MKRKLQPSVMTLVVVVALFSTASAQSQSQSLGDYARAVKKNKPAQANSSNKTYDNDNLPTKSSLSVVGSAASDDAKSDDTKKDNAEAAKEPPKQSAGSTGDNDKTETKPELKPDQSSADRQNAIGEWKQKLEAQKSKVDLASRELDVMQREYRVKMAEFYANTASRVQNPNGFASDDAKYKQQIADRQKAVDEARKKLTDMQDEARKAGVPNSALE